MHSLLKTNVAADWLFYRRNKLLALIGLLFIFIWAMTFIPSLLFRSSSNKFELIQQTVVAVGWFINVFVAALGILAISHHLNARCLKMVLTKPCPMETWVLAKWISALLVSAGLHLLVLVVAVLLFLAWNIPLQVGLFYVVADAFLHSVIIVSMLIMLTSVIHPFVAVLVMLVFGESTFYGLTTLLAATVKTATGHTSKLLLQIAKTICEGLYWALPTYMPFEQETRTIYSSLRLQWADLSYMGLTFVYAVILGVFFYVLTVLALKRRRLT